MRSTTMMKVAAVLVELALGSSSVRQDAKCCYVLSRSSLASRVYFPNDTLYETRLESYWSVSAALSPTCMVLPSSAADVADIIQYITANKCSFGIRGGGHGSFSLSNSIAEGITIDFGLMNSTTYNSDTKIVSIEPGSSWQPVYETLAPYGVTVTGGRAGTVGNFELVLANGSLVNANANENADLWQAIKGGSGNFGLITRFDLYAIEFPSSNATDIWGGILIYDLNATAALIDIYVKFAENVETDQNSSSIIYWAYIPAAGGMILNAALENTINTVSPPAFDGYLSTPGITATSLRSAPMYEITAELGSGQPSGYRNIWFSGAYKNDARILNFAVQKHEEIVARIEAEMSEDSGLNTLCMFQPITQIMVQHSVDNGGNMLGLEDRVKKGNGVMFLATLAVNGNDNEAKALPLMQEWQDAVDEYATSLGANWDWRYLNYAYKTQEPIASYGKTSVARLKAVSTKYDPEQVFQNLRRSGFKIPA